MSAGRCGKWAALAAIFFGMWAATQFTAWKAGYAPDLGSNVHGIYPPWSVVLWAAEHRIAPEMLAGAGSFGAITEYVQRKKPIRPKHGEN